MKKNQKKPPHRVPGQNGGYRPGSGRKKGTPNKLTGEIKARILASGESPLDVMMAVMREYRTAADKLGDKYVVVGQQVIDRLKLLHQAADIASMAAPYVHSKLQAIEHSGKDNGPIRHQVEFVFVEPNGQRYQARTPH